MKRLIALCLLLSSGCSHFNKQDKYRLETMGPKLEKYKPVIEEKRLDEKTRNITIQFHLFENMTVKAI